jgi:hypothetical protein
MGDGLKRAFAAAKATRFPTGPKLRTLPNGATFPLRLMARSDGYVMVRHPQAIPFVMREADWRALPDLSKPNPKQE